MTRAAERDAATRITHDEVETLTEDQALSLEGRVRQPLPVLFPADLSLEKFNQSMEALKNTQFEWVKGEKKPYMVKPMVAFRLSQLDFRSNPPERVIKSPSFMTQIMDGLPIQIKVPRQKITPASSEASAPSPFAALSKPRPFHRTLAESLAEFEENVMLGYKAFFDAAPDVVVEAKQKTFGLSQLIYRSLPKRHRVSSRDAM